MMSVIIPFGFIGLSALAADQPMWGRDGSRNMVSEEKGLPASFDPADGRNILWAAPLGGKTFSTPVVAGGRVFVGTSNENPRDPRRIGDRGVMLCLDEKDGSLHWQLVVPKITTSVYWDWPKAGQCSPATVEGDRVYTVSNRGEVMCLDIHGLSNGNDGPYLDEARHAVPDGEAVVELGPLDADIIWSYDLIGEQGVRQHDSSHASILIDGPYLYVNTSIGVDDSHKQLDAPEAPSLVVIDKRTGRLAAREREGIGARIFHCTWSSPAQGVVNGQNLVFFGGGDGILYAFQALEHSSEATSAEAVDLRKIWSYDGDPGAPKENISQYLRNREESPSNIKGMPVFHEGRVFYALGGDFWWGKRKAWLHCVDAAKNALLWSYPLNRHCMSTPAIHEGLVYITDCAGTIHGLDAGTGKGYWTAETRGSIWSSPLVADGKVYVTSQRGEVVVLATGKTLRELGRIELGGSISASPVAANGVLYIATHKTLYAVKSNESGE
ncbi:MAG: PQQ-binding-like beta-propeller repeat protein [Kiritimatiellales bacterium]|nr:PQQ-binding-like beta-propeller repeat protein [Kiritimatiellales bacterium]